MRYKVLLLTSGIGSRLGNITTYTNKSLVRIGLKPSISHIIEKYPKEIEIVVTLGHFGEQVRDFLLLAYSDRKFTFVNVDNYNGPGSSLIYSMLCAKNSIDCPFIFQTCDTIIKDEVIQEPSFNWLGGSDSKNSSQYATITSLNDDVQSVNPKGCSDFSHVYIGLAGIYNYNEFFDYAQLLYNNNYNNSQLSDIHIYPKMINDGISFKNIILKTWLDIGNTDKLKESRKLFKGLNVLDKDTESIFICDNNVIKFFYDKKIVENRVKRGKNLYPLVPKINGSIGNFYSYEFVNGDLLSEVINPKKTKELIEWANNKLWVQISEKNSDFYNRCYDFYFNKTQKRVCDFLLKYNMIDCDDIINGEHVPSIASMLDIIQKDYLCDVPEYIFHGDFILDNIIATDNGFSLLDWRHDFGGSVYSGDVYYDLSKLNHSLIFNHNIVLNGNFLVHKNDEVKIDILTSYNLLQCRDVLIDFVNDNGFDMNKIDIISSIIWLNMSSLHHYPIDMFLYYFGKYNLYKILRKAGV